MLIINAIAKYMIISLIVSAFAVGMNSDNILYYIGSGVSVIFGFLMQVAHIRKRKAITTSMIIWNSITTMCICYVMALLWHTKFSSYGDIRYFIYLFLSSYMALVLAEALFGLMNTNIKNWKQRIARSLLMEDKEDKK